MKLVTTQSVVETTDGSLSLLLDPEGVPLAVGLDGTFFEVVALSGDWAGNQTAVFMDYNHDKAYTIRRDKRGYTANDLQLTTSVSPPAPVIFRPAPDLRKQLWLFHFKDLGGYFYITGSAIKPYETPRLYFGRPVRMEKLDISAIPSGDQIMTCQGILAIKSGGKAEWRPNDGPVYTGETDGRRPIAMEFDDYASLNM